MHRDQLMKEILKRTGNQHTGQDIVRESPQDLNLSNNKDIEKLKDELNKAVREGFSQDYENLIRKYYEALQKEKIAN